MPILRIEHSVPDFSGWKHAFDSDPVDARVQAFAGSTSFARWKIRTT